MVYLQSAENPSSSKPWAFSPAMDVVPQPQVVFLQPVVPQRPAPVPKRRRHRKYLPILKSYPKIAPHPPTSRSSSVKSSSSSDGHEATEQRPESTDDSLASTACSDDTDNKITRFCNTYNVLSNSGLLDITLRTKELIRQNRRTQTELDRLRQHTNLLVEALQTGDSEIWSKLQTSVQAEDMTPSHEENLEWDEDTAHRSFINGPLLSDCSSSLQQEFSF